MNDGIEPYREDMTPEEKTDNWLHRAFHEVIECIEGMGGVLSYRAWPDFGIGKDGKDVDPHDDDTLWFMEVYETYTEVCEDSADDGSYVWSGINVNISEIAYRFNSLSSIHLSGMPGGEPPSIDLDGHYLGRHLALSVLIHPPSDAEAGQRMYKDGSFEFIDEDDDEDEDEDDEE